MIVEVPEELEAALLIRANARGVSPAGYVCAVLMRELDAAGDTDTSTAAPFKSLRGVLAKYGPAPSAEEIDANRADMFRGFGENF